MKPLEIPAMFEQAAVAQVDRDTAIDSLEWIAHPAFAGVFMKHLVKGEETDGRLSCHMVKVEGGRELGLHRHDGQLELHEVINGEGTGFLGEREIGYAPGRMTIIPQGVPHKVQAGPDGLVLLAKFVPALL